ncbi:DUF418 domain-containing protein [Streptomyces sp. DSM 44917]|uniref:DUF418 domain-containing protein n=1 Tax=Streptomyces boetiae TaxID=3075541 RepID=A0ABU2LD42_9ACTN|nr:DUF418 domain-containing protein [Streptomyces sp. DSM 44917]MDT0309496.1 DUF418 domain-containing protein [Streptomyces sp. DSM 44917]
MSGGMPAPGPGTARLAGLDLARGLAVFGMYAAHVGPMPDETGGVTGFVMELAHGRSSALFAVLAGVTLVLLAGGARVPGRRPGRAALIRIAVRAVILLALGTALTASSTPVVVILAYYGLYFLLALPLLRLGAGALALLAAAGALAGPPLLMVLSRAAYDADGDYRGWWGTFASFDPLYRWSGDGLLELLITGDYPALTWLPFVLLGMALARLGFSPALRPRLLALGAGLAVLGYGGSWLALRHAPGVASATGSAQAWWSDSGVNWSGYANEPGWLLVGAPHSQTTFSVVGNAGVAVAVIAGALLALDRWAAARRVAAPLIAVGAMSLTAYGLHVLLIAVLGLEELDGYPLRVLLAFVAVACGFALLWRRRFRRGPLEYLMHRATAAVGSGARRGAALPAGPPGC